MIGPHDLALPYRQEELGGGGMEVVYKVLAANIGGIEAGKIKAE